MAGFIEVAAGHEWSSANWVYYSIMDGVLEDISRLGNDELKTDVEQSKWMQTFSITGTPVDEWKALLIDSLKRVCDLVEAGKLVAKVEGKSLDESSQVQFRNAVRKLAEELAAITSESAPKSDVAKGES
jgi:hypothetical protein